MLCKNIKEKEGSLAHCGAREEESTFFLFLEASEAIIPTDIEADRERQRERERATFAIAKRENALRPISTRQLRRPKNSIVCLVRDPTTRGEIQKLFPLYTSERQNVLLRMGIDTRSK